MRLSKSIVNNSPPRVTAFDGLMSFAIAEAIYESVPLRWPGARMR